MAHTILHWNGFDSGSNLASDYPGSDFNSASHSYYSLYSSWTPFYGGYGRFVGMAGASLRLAPKLNSPPYNSLGAQMLFGINSTGVSETTIMHFWDGLAGAEQISFRIAWNGTTSKYDLRIYRGATLLSTVPGFCLGAVANAWTWISAMVYVHPTAGRIHLRTGLSDGVSFSFTGNTQNTANQRIDYVEVGMIGGMPTFFIDDLVISQCLPSDDSMRRMRVIGAITPSGSDLSGLSVSGSPTNWQAVNEIPPNGDTSYVYGNVPGAQDTYLVNWPSISNTIAALEVGLRCRREEAGTRLMAPLLKRGSNVYQGAAAPTGPNYLLLKSEWLNDPETGEPWRPDVLNSAASKIGLRIV